MGGSVRGADRNTQTIEGEEIMAKRIYMVQTVTAPMARRLIRAETVAQAFRFVANDTISAALASQDELVACGKADIPIETATPDEPKPAVVAVPVTAEELEASAREFPASVTELPAHMDPRQKAGVG